MRQHLEPGTQTMWWCPDCGHVFRKPARLVNGERYHSWKCQDPMEESWVNVKLRCHVLVGGQKLFNVHAPSKCAGEFCTIHNPSDHHMRDWAQNWRGDRGLMERLCPDHGIGHPDPDDPNPDRMHGCDGCCRPPETS